MRVIVAGGRDYRFTDNDFWFLDGLNITELVSGGAPGADACGEIWAKSRGVPIKRFTAEWGEYGRRAGPIRNAQMAAYAEAVVLYPGGRGTQSMRREAQKVGIVIHEAAT